MSKESNQNIGNRQKNFERQKPSEEENFEKNCKSKFGENYLKYFLNPDNLPYDLFIEKIKDFLKDKASKISTSQIRNVFSMVKKEKDVNGLKRIRPKLAYIYGRAEKNNDLKELIFLMDSQIKGLESPSDVPKLKDFFEAIISYHKYYGGKD